MNEAEYNSLVDRIHAKCAASVTAAESERDADLAALQRVFALCQQESCGAHAQVVPTPVKVIRPVTAYGGGPAFPDHSAPIDVVVANPPYSPRRGEVTEAVRAAIEEIGPGLFSWRDVDAQIELSKGVNFNRTTISQVLDKLASAGVIEVHEQGAGKRATVYRPAETFAETLERNRG